MPSTDTQTDRQTQAKIRVLQDFRKSDQQTHNNNEYSGHLFFFVKIFFREPIFLKKYIVDTFNHANTRRMKKGKGLLNSLLKTLMGHLKDIKIRLFCFQDPGPSSIIEVVDMVKQC